jgi:hypothetical protein
MKRARKERLISTSLIRRLCLSLLLLFGGWASLPMYAQKAVTLNLTNQLYLYQTGRTTNRLQILLRRTKRRRRSACQCESAESRYKSSAG